MNPVVDLTTAEVLEALKMAEQTFRVFANAPGHYANTVNSHFRGKLGELACSRWLAANGASVEQVFGDAARMRECDIIVSGDSCWRLDVKTWDQAYWAELGRCVAAGQLAALRNKADAVLWCTSPSKLSPERSIHIEIAGWNNIADIETAPRRLTGPRGRRQVDNHQVEPENVRPVSELMTLLNPQRL